MARRLTRNTRKAVLAGVAAGFGDYFDVDPILVRLGFIFLCFFGGTGILLYIVSWILMPPDVEPARGVNPEVRNPSDGEDGGQDAGEVPPAERLAREAAEAGERVARGAAQAGERVARGAAEAAGRIRERLPESAGRGRLIFGVILIALGMFFLADRFLPFRWWWVWDLWPLALVAIGLLILVNAARGAER